MNFATTYNFFSNFKKGYTCVLCKTQAFHVLVVQSAGVNLLSSFVYCGRSIFPGAISILAVLRSFVLCPDLHHLSSRLLTNKNRKAYSETLTRLTRVTSHPPRAPRTPPPLRTATTLTTAQNTLTIDTYRPIAALFDHRKSRSLA